MGLGTPYADTVYQVGLKEGMIELLVDSFGDAVFNSIQGAEARGQFSTKSIHVLVPCEILVNCNA